ncbi:hypothetical protein ACLOJK_026916 [Asimina triloba]
MVLPYPIEISPQAPRGEEGDACAASPTLDRCLAATCLLASAISSSSSSAQSLDLSDSPVVLSLPSSSSPCLRRPLFRLDPKTLFLDHNAFSCNFPPSILKLHRIFFVDLSHNNLSSALPPKLAALDRLYSLRFDRNRFTSNMPPLNQSSLKVFNVSQNNLNGSLPAMTLLAGFGTSTFVGNPGLCGEVVHKHLGQLADHEREAVGCEQDMGDDQGGNSSAYENIKILT